MRGYSGSAPEKEQPPRGMQQKQPFRRSSPSEATAPEWESLPEGKPFIGLVTLGVFTVGLLMVISSAG